MFVCEDDLWSVSADGGDASRLTQGPAEVATPRLSGDGSLLAFAAKECGPAEIHVMPAVGGVARRLTHQGISCAVVGWHPRTGDVLYASSAGGPFEDTWLHAVDPTGGAPRRLPIGPASGVAFGPAGAMVLARGNTDPAYWKRYRGGGAGELWIDPDGSGAFSRLVTLPGNLVSPCWVGRRIYFIADHEDAGNVYSCATDGSDLRRHTGHTDYYARNLSTDGTNLVYQLAAELYLCDPNGCESSKLDIRVNLTGTHRRRRTEAGGRSLDSASLHPDGTRLAISARGKVFSFDNWDGPVRQHPTPDGMRCRLLAWLPDGRRLVATATDDTPGDAVVVLATGEDVAPLQRLELGDLGRITELSVAPTGNKVAVANHRHELFGIELESRPGGPVKRLDHSRFGPITDLAWAPDGTWLAYTFPNTAETTAVKLCRVETGQTGLVAGPVLRDSRPTFDPEGRYLYFIGLRHFHAVRDELHADLGFRDRTLPYAVALRPNLSDDQGSLEIDLRDIERRVVPLPVRAGGYRRIAALPGKVLLTRSATPPGEADELYVYDLRTHDLERIARAVGGMEISRDHGKVLCVTGRELRVVAAGVPLVDGTEPGRVTGIVDLDRVTVSLLPAAEWRQMFREAWTLQHQHFWREDLAGVDWDAMYDRYSPLLDRVSTRSELSDLIGELHGELGTSHANERLGDHEQHTERPQGFLGIDGDYEPAGWRVRRVVAGDPWDPSSTSPCHRFDVDIRGGDLIVSIDGQPVGRAGPGELLVNRGAADVLLSVVRPGARPRLVTVRPSRSERALRYRDWVLANQRRVWTRTGGRVGYLHIPDMGARGYAEFYRALLTEYDRKGLIIDVRFNGGGHAAALIAEKLSRLRLGVTVPRWGTPQPYPAEAPRGDMVAITNEYTGSDGEIFSHIFRMLRLGPVIGTRTWGGATGIRPRHRLVDGTVTTQPEYAFVFDDVGRDLENCGTQPDVEVAIAPHDFADGKDPQLDRAIDTILELLTVSDHGGFC